VRTSAVGGRTAEIASSTVLRSATVVRADRATVGTPAAASARRFCARGVGGQGRGGRGERDRQRWERVTAMR